MERRKIMSIQQNQGGNALLGAIALIISIVLFLFVGSLSWLFPVEMIKFLQYLAGTLIIISLLVIW
jgi:EamA domain-containing membrane protein RarD